MEPEETIVPTTFQDIERRFHSMPMTKFEIPEELEQEWLKTAIDDYELELGAVLSYDAETLEFSEKLDGKVIRLLALMMYVSYLQRELSRVMALNGIYGKDLRITGGDTTKRVTKQELETEIYRVNVRLHKMKQHSYE